MTDKQIIINDVDVSGCECFYINASHPERKECINPYCKGLCEDNPNCYYKQLKRQEQECESLKSENSTFEELVKTQEENIAELIRRYNQRSSECEDYKTLAKQHLADFFEKEKECEKLKREKPFSSNIKQLEEKIEELTREGYNYIERIKYQENFIDSLLQATNNFEWINKSILDDEADAIIEKVQEDYNKMEKYKKAFDEIEKIANEREIFCENCTGGVENFTCNDCGYCKILDIISEAKEQ